MNQFSDADLTVCHQFLSNLPDEENISFRIFLSQNISRKSMLLSKRNCIDLSGVGTWDCGSLMTNQQIIIQIKTINEVKYEKERRQTFWWLLI